LCLSCRLTRIRPGDDDRDGLASFAETEAAKRRLVFQLPELGLPVDPYEDDTDEGLAFDLLSSQFEKVAIGHTDGLITLNLSESDDAYREGMRHDLGESYRTMLDICVTRPGTTTYANMHPFEDWAETFAQYLHIRDTLQTAGAFGLRSTGPAVATVDDDANELTSTPVVDSGGSSFDEILADWLPLTYALNAVNQSMGNGDLYPFVLPPKVVEKLAFVHHVVGNQHHDPSRT
jgi:hypothetical protein